MTGLLKADLRQALTLRQLRIFLLTAQTGSASKAARQLGISQPAVSQQIQDLEKLLRIKLFERVGIRLLPTSAGLALLEPIRRTLTAVDLIEPAVAPFRGAETSYVRVGTGATACIHFLPAPIAQTRARNPGLQVLVVTGNVNELVEGVEDGHLDLALVTAEKLNPGPALQTEPLFSERFLAIVPPDLGAHMPERIGAEDLLRHPLILFEPAGRTREITDGWFHGQRLRPVPSMELGSVEAIKNMVAAGLGVSLIPELATGSDDKNLVIRPLDPPLQRHLCIVMRHDKIMDKGLRAFLAELKKAAKERFPTS